jgi:MBG domain (YGX type)
LSAVTYGSLTTLPLTATASSGLPVTYQVVSGPGTIPAKGSTLSINGGGTIVITASQYGNDVYAEAPPVTRSLVVNPANLTVTGPTVTLSYGAAIDPTTFPAVTITGFVGADTQASTITGQARYTTVTGTPNAGTYPISVGLGTLSLVPAAAASYVLSTLVNGNLIVQAQAQVITFNPAPSSQIYGNIVPLTAVAVSGFPITFTETGPADFYNGISTTAPPINNSVQIVFTGTGTVTVTANQAGGSNFGPAPPVTQVFNVAPAPLDITAYPPQVLEEGAPLPANFPYVIGNPSGGPGGFVNGDKDIPSVITGLPTLTTTATLASPPGVYPIVPTQGTLAAPNYAFNFINGTLTITPPGSFNISASPSSLTIPAGLTGQSTLTITPTNAYQGTVTLSCGQLPANVTCEISPSTYHFPGSQNPNGSENPAQGTITITSAGGIVVGSKNGANDSISRATVLLIPGLFTGLLAVFARKRLTKYSNTWRAIALVALGAGLLLTISCGGSSKSLTSTPGTMTVMITGSGTSVSGSGAVTSSAALTVTIQ